VFDEYEQDGLGALALADGDTRHARLGHQSFRVPLLNLSNPFEGGFALPLREQAAGEGQHTEGDNRCWEQPEQSSS
jgi:hypothetical protein